MSKIANSVVKNPVVVLFLATVFVVGSTASLKGAIPMAISALLTLVLSSVILAALNKTLTKDIRLIAIILVVVTVSSVSQILMNAFFYSGYQLVSTYIAVLAVDLAIFTNVKQCSKLSVKDAFVTSLKTGLFYAVVLLAIAVVREVLGAGSIYGYELSFLDSFKLPILQTSFGGYFLLAIVLALVNDENQCQDVASVVFDGCSCCEQKGE